MPADTSPRSRALFLDRDGTLIVHIPYLHRADGVALIPGVPEALAAARSAGFRLYLFTNQSGVGRGMFDLAAVHDVNDRMIELIGLGRDLFAGACIAPETPDQPSRYRKPSPNFIRETCERDGLDPKQVWMIGDSPSDWEAGVSAGVHAAAVGVEADEPEKNRALRKKLGVPGFPDLKAAMAFIAP